MKSRAFKGLIRAALGLCAAASLSVSRAQTDGKDLNPTASASPAKKGDGHKGKRSKGGKDTGDPTLPPKARKEFPFPLPVGQKAHDAKVPSYDQVGKVLSVLQAAEMTRTDDEHVQMDGMTFDLNGTDGGEDYKIEMPVCVLNLKTNIVTSDHPVVIRTRDFELTGEKMEFDTVERTGELRGRVHMRIHNLKQVALPDGKPAS